MLQRKITPVLEKKLRSSGAIPILNGARQTGKTFIIRHVSKRLYKNFVEINFAEDNVKERIFKDVGSVRDCRAVNVFFKERNMFFVRSVHENIHRLYSTDAFRYVRA